jgi:hypothetical protein
MLLFRGDLTADSGAIADIGPSGRAESGQADLSGASLRENFSTRSGGVESGRNGDERNNESGNSGDGAVLGRTDD